MTAKKIVRPNSGAARIRALMADGKPRTVAQISGIVSDVIPLDSVSEFMRRYSKPGDKQEFHSVDRRGANESLRYVCGRGSNVEKEETVTAQRYWPAADALVLDSINAMVRQGARA